MKEYLPDGIKLDNHTFEMHALDAELVVRKRGHGRLHALARLVLGHGADGGGLVVTAALRLRRILLAAVLAMCFLLQSALIIHATLA